MEALRGDDLHRRHAGDRLRHFAVGVTVRSVPRALADRGTCRRQERDRPRARELVRDHLACGSFDFCFGGGARSGPRMPASAVAVASVLGAVASDETTSSEAASWVARTIGLAWVRAPFFKGALD